jgi:hypothetical protein
MALLIYGADQFGYLIYLSISAEHIPGEEFKIRFHRKIAIGKTDRVPENVLRIKK